MSLVACKKSPAPSDALRWQRHLLAVPPSLAALQAIISSWRAAASLLFGNFRVFTPG